MNGQKLENRALPPPGLLSKHRQDQEQETLVLMSRECSTHALFAPVTSAALAPWGRTRKMGGSSLPPFAEGQKHGHSFLSCGNQRGNECGLDTALFLRATPEGALSGAQGIFSYIHSFNPPNSLMRELR